MFQTIIKKYQLTYSANNWEQTIKNREVAKNNYRATGDIKKAKAFVNSVVMYKPHTHFVEHGEHVIFSNQGLALAPEPAYAL
jgi:hypothetical protein